MPRADGTSRRARERAETSSANGRRLEASLDHDALLITYFAGLSSVSHPTIGSRDPGSRRNLIVPRRRLVSGATALHLHLGLALRRIVRIESRVIPCCVGLHSVRHLDVSLTHVVRMESRIIPALTFPSRADGMMPHWRPRQIVFDLAEVCRQPRNGEDIYACAMCKSAAERIAALER